MQIGETVKHKFHLNVIDVEFIKENQGREYNEIRVLFVKNAFWI